MSFTPDQIPNVLGCWCHQSAPPMRSSKLLWFTAIAFALLALAIFVSWIPGSPPTMHYIGTSTDGSELVFEIRNQTSSRWNFPGMAADAPNYRVETDRTALQMGFGTPSDPTAVNGNRYPLAPWSTVRLRIPHPAPEAKWINVAVMVIPGSFSFAENLFEYYSNTIRRSLGLPATNGARLIQRRIEAAPDNSPHLGTPSRWSEDDRRKQLRF